MVEASRVVTPRIAKSIPVPSSRPCRPERKLNAEQASIRASRKPTLLRSGKAADRLGRERREHRPVSAGVVAPACMEDGRRSNTGSPAGAVHAATGTPRGGQAGPAGWRRGP